jgi:GntR family transcriptional regulator/MocR family aminotransferase
MKRRPDSLGPIVALDRRLAAPLHRQLHAGYRAAILDGRLRPGQRLPSTRSLASDLAVSRVPVVMAFEQLAAEGFVEGRVGAGSFVANALPRTDKPATTQRPPAGRRRLPRERLTSEPEPWFACHGGFRVGQPGLDQFPVEVWARLIARRARMQPRQQMTYGDAMGFLPLREALAEHLRTVRSVRCTAAQIMIVSGSQQALALASRAVLAPGDVAWVEDPGFVGARDALALAGARVVPVPVDADGLDVAAGVARCPAPRAVYVTPSHQYPLGVVMSPARRAELLALARRRGAWLFEDDYDSEYRYDDQPPIASLHGLDPDRRVIYIGTFSKVLFPAIRVGYAVIPDDLIARFVRVRRALDNFPPPLYQAALSDFIRDGHFARHLRRTRSAYAERRRALIRALRRELGDRVDIIGDRSGMHLVARIDGDDQDIATRAAARGLSVIPLSSCYAGRARRRGLLLGFGALRPSEIAARVRELAAVIASR